MKRCIHATAEEVLGEHNGSGNRKKPYWWDEDIEREITEKRQKYHKYLTTKEENDKISYRQSQARVRKKITQKKNESWEKTCQRINAYIGESRSTESWKTIKSLRKDTTNEIISSITIEEWERYFKDLLTENRIEFGEETRDTTNINIISSPIRLTQKEVEEACRSLKNGKSPGPGDIPNELLKIGTKTLHEHLRKLFQECLNGANIPEEWKISLVSTIHKKGDKN